MFFQLEHKLRYDWGWIVFTNIKDIDKKRWMVINFSKEMWTDIEYEWEFLSDLQSIFYYHYW